MEWINDLGSHYSEFFSWSSFVNVVTDPMLLGVIFTLVILEIMLSIDNSIVLGAMVKHLPTEQRKKALFYGLVGAYLFRFIAIGLSTILMKITWIKIVGALYLLYLAAKYFYEKFRPQDKNQDGVADHLQRGFWMTIVQVELMDIAFSVDSILAAIAVSEEVWVVFIAGLVGILAMRGVAGIFIKLLEKVPELEATAYFLILLIALKMGTSVFGIHVSHVAFFAVVILSIVGTLVINQLKKKSLKAQV